MTQAKEKLPVKPKPKAIGSRGVGKLKRGDILYGSGDQWKVETLLNRRPVVLCSSVTTGSLREIPFYEIRYFTRSL